MKPTLPHRVSFKISNLIFKRYNYLGISCCPVAKLEVVWMSIKAVLLDLGDTLVGFDRFDYDACLRELHKSLSRDGVTLPYEHLKKAYFEEELCGGRRKQRKSGQNNPEDRRIA